MSGSPPDLSRVAKMVPGRVIDCHACSLHGRPLGPDPPGDRSRCDGGRRPRQRTGAPAAARPPTDHGPSPSAASAAPTVEHSSGEPHNARLTIPKVSIRQLPVIAYRGKTDDAPGTKIQNRGIAAAPTARTAGPARVGWATTRSPPTAPPTAGSSGTPRASTTATSCNVDAGRWRYVYQVIKTRWVSFRSAKSLREQRAPVPGKPGQERRPRLHHRLHLRDARGPRRRQLLDRTSSATPSTGSTRSACWSSGWRTPTTLLRPASRRSPRSRPRPGSAGSAAPRPWPRRPGAPRARGRWRSGRARRRWRPRRPGVRRAPTPRR